MILVVAEKYSVGMAIAAVLGANKNNKTHFEGNGYIVSWCAGHLCELARPEIYDMAYKKWDIKALPIIPQKWEFEIIEETKGQFYALQKLMNSKDVTEIICATDAGREGENIFRFVYMVNGCRKPVMRLWVSSVEISDIRNGLENLKPDSFYDALFESGYARAKADWIIGMNASRLFSLVSGISLTIGRVQTPTLNLLVKRDDEIKNFVSEKYYTVTLNYKGMTAETDRIDDYIFAMKLAEDVNTSGQAFVKSVEVMEKTVNPPKLFNLADLQKTANRLLKITAQNALDIAQKLYEMGLITYPRTDSNFVNESMREKISLLSDISADFLGTEKFTANADSVIDNSKVTDHHALLPTVNLENIITIQGLTAIEKQLLRLICIQLLCAVSSPHKYEQTTLVLESSDNDFKASGNKITDNGWKNIQKSCYEKYFQKTNRSEDKIIPKEIVKGLVLDGVTSECITHNTTPPKRFTDGTLITAMEKAGECGIGTQATQSGIIEKMINKNYAVRDGMNIIPTETGRKLISSVPEVLKSPELTAGWEKRLAQIEKGSENAADFMRDIEKLVSDLVSEYSHLAVERDKEKIIGKCPVCQKNILDTPKAYSCEGGKNGCGFIIWKNTAGINISKETAQKLLENGKTEKITNFRSKSGKTFDAKLCVKDGKIEFLFE